MLLADGIGQAGERHADERDGCQRSEHGFPRLDRENRQSPARSGVPVPVVHPGAGGHIGGGCMGRLVRPASGGDRSGDRHLPHYRCGKPALARERASASHADAGDVHAFPAAWLRTHGDAGGRRGRTFGPVCHCHARQHGKSLHLLAYPRRGSHFHDGQPRRRCRFRGDDPAGGHRLSCGGPSPAGGHRRQLCRRIGWLFGKPVTRSAGRAAAGHHGGQREYRVRGLDGQHRRQLVFHRRHDDLLPAGDLVRH